MRLLSHKYFIVVV